jgi:hypothetical protein
LYFSNEPGAADPDASAFDAFNELLAYTISTDVEAARLRHGAVRGRPSDMLSFMAYLTVRYLERARHAGRDAYALSFGADTIGGKSLDRLLARVETSWAAWVSARDRVWPKRSDQSVAEDTFWTLYIATKQRLERN